MTFVKPTLQRIELRFWKSAISLMQTSTLVRRLMPWLYRATTEYSTENTILAVAVLIFTGGSIGFLLGILSHLH